MKLSEMKHLLVTGDIRLTKSLGQNFLHDGNQLRRIGAVADLGPGDRVLEIGPGLGPLTEILVARAGQVLAIEKDGRLVAHLRERFRAAANLILHHADALEWLRQEPRDWREWKVVSNLPYAVASPILVELAHAPASPRLIVATVQWEVALRLLAPAAAPDYGVLTLLVQLQYEPQAWFKIPASCFFPKPDVNSACLTLARRSQPRLAPGEVSTFVRLVKRAFSQRRKMMLKLLKTEWPAARLESAFEQCGLSAQTRAEAVSLDQFVELSRKLTGP